MSLRLAVLATAATLGACTGPTQLGLPPDGPVDPQTQEAPDEPHFACAFYWRKSDAHDHTRTETVAIRSGTQRVALEGFDVAVTSDWADNPKLGLEIGLGGSMVRSEHEFEGTPERMTEAGHGFTGLQYLTDNTGAEVQYWCGAAGPGFESDSDPAPARQPAATVSCEASATTIDGETVGPKTFTVAPNAGQDPVSVGPFSLAVNYMASEYEGNAVVIDAGEAAAKPSPSTVHTLFQFGASGPPANTMAGPSFTGTQSLEAGGQTLRYRCWTDA